MTKTRQSRKIQDDRDEDNTIVKKTTTSRQRQDNSENIILSRRIKQDDRGVEKETRKREIT